MKEIPQEQRLERYDTVPQALRDALNSEVIDEILQTIGEAHHLGEERTFKMVKIYGLIVLGFIHPQDLQREITSELSIDKRLAEEIAHELQIKILNPLLPEIDTAFNYHITGIRASSSPVAALSLAPQPEVIRPIFAPPSNMDQPFILHEGQKETESARPRDEALVRPSFYDPPSPPAGGFGGQGREAGIERPMAARLEIGNMEERTTDEPKVGKTEEPPIRVVHYSGPQTPVDPFAPQQMANGEEQRAEPQQQPKDIHPENVVDLKDLPK